MPPKIGRPRVPLYDRIDPYICKDESNPDACWLWTGGVDKNGYGCIKSPPDENGKKRSQRIHRIMYERYNGPIPQDKPLIMHSCDTPACCNPKHLTTATPAENSADMVAKGRSKASSASFKKGEQSGENNTRAKLNWEKVAQIRASEDTYAKLAVQYDVSESTIRSILKNRIWKPA
jgi:hypothetical protein